MLFLGNDANELICLDSFCEISNVTMSEYTGSCQCKIQSELSLILQNKTNKQISFDNKGNNNFPVFACYSKGFNKNILKTNVGFYLGIIFIVIQAVSFVIYIVFSKSPKHLKIPANPPLSTNSLKSKDVSEMLFLDDFDEIMKENGMKIMNDTENKEMDYQEKDDIIEDLKSELSGNYLKTMLALFTDPIEYDVDNLKEAVKGLGTDEDCLIEILASRPGWYIDKIKKKYKEKYKINSLNPSSS